MSSVFRGTRGDIESGFTEFIPERPSLRVRAARPVNTNSLTFLVTVLLLFMILNSPQVSPNFLLWLVVGIFLLATSLRIYAACQQLQARAHAAAASRLLGNTELRLRVPPSIAFATRGCLPGLRLQLSLLDREFDELDYDTLRALHIDSPSTTPAMTEEEINSLPVHNYKVPCPESAGPSSQQSSSSSGSLNEANQDSSNTEGSAEASEDELTCTVCLDIVNRGEIVRSLPCLHQFHADCIDPWLREQGTCPICKFRMGSGRQDSTESDSDDSDLV